MNDPFHLQPDAGACLDRHPAASLVKKGPRHKPQSQILRPSLNARSARRRMPEGPKMSDLALADRALMDRARCPNRDSRASYRAGSWAETAVRCGADAARSAGTDAATAT